MFDTPERCKVQNYVRTTGGPVMKPEKVPDVYSGIAVEGHGRFMTNSRMMRNSKVGDVITYDGVRLFVVLRSYIPYECFFFPCLDCTHNTCCYAEDRPDIANVMFIPLEGL